jgi:16S rRNA (guanine1207-N2)-methyltransferase
MPELLARWLEEGEARLVPETGFVSRPGLFGWNKVDEGSRLLAEHMPARLSGAVADLGAGWGYLTTELLARCPKAERIDLYEAEWLALAAARENVGRRAPAIPVSFNWQDVTAPGIPRRSYDRVVMNPPFHGSGGAGKATEHDLGRAFILAAAEALRPGGTMLLVANRHLPYEAVIDQKFRGKIVLAESNAFKVIEARL